MGSLRFRQATPADADTVLAIKRAAIESIDSGEYTDEELIAWRPDEDALEDFERAIESDIFTILVAEKDDQVAAYGGLNTNEKRIDAIYVHPEYMGEGIAQSLVRQFETRAKMVGLDELKIMSSLNATGFYESLGYWHFGTKIRSINGHDVEFAVMRKMFEFHDEHEEA